MSEWISVKERVPDTEEGKDYSKNVWGWDGKKILVVELFWDIDRWRWGNCYGDVFGVGEFDDDYNITHWMPINFPKPPGK